MSIIYVGIEYKFTTVHILRACSDIRIIGLEIDVNCVGDLLLQMMGQVTTLILDLPSYSTGFCGWIQLYETYAKDKPRVCGTEKWQDSQACA